MHAPVVMLQSVMDSPNKTTDNNILKTYDDLESREGEGEDTSGDLNRIKTHDQKIHLIHMESQSCLSPTGSCLISPTGSVTPDTEDGRARDANEIDATDDILQNVKSSNSKILLLRTPALGSLISPQSSSPISPEKNSELPAKLICTTSSPTKLSPQITDTKIILLNHDVSKSSDEITANTAVVDVNGADESEVSSPMIGFVADQMGPRNMDDYIRPASDDCTDESIINNFSEKKELRLDLILNNDTLKTGNFSNEYDDKLRSPVQYCKKFKEDIKHNTIQNKFPKVRRISHNNKKVKIKDEKKVSRGELDEIFERIKMKKSLQEARKKKNETVKTENVQNIEEKKNNWRSSEEKSNRDEKVKTDEKKLYNDEKKQRKKKIEMKNDENREKKVQSKLSDWIKTLSPKKDENNYENDEKKMKNETIDEKDENEGQK